MASVATPTVHKSAKSVDPYLFIVCYSSKSIPQGFEQVPAAVVGGLGHGGKCPVTIFWALYAEAVNMSYATSLWLVISVCYNNLV